MPSITTHPESYVSFVVKNTFIDIKREVVDYLPRRSNSVPPAFKLCGYVDSAAPCRTVRFGKCTCVDLADDSTNASDKASDKDFPERWSDHDVPDYCSDCTEEDDTSHQGVESVSQRLLEQPATRETGVGKVTLTLDNMVTEESRRKLRSQAQPFKSARAPPSEVVKMIASAVDVLMSSKDIVDVTVHDGGMGGTTVITAQSSRAQPDSRCSFSLVKDTLLRLAEHSENTYVLGYGAQPFNNLDNLSFSTKLAHVPPAHRGKECWDHYEKGFCSQCSRCCWNHPSEIDMMRIIVMIKKYA